MSIGVYECCGIVIIEPCVLQRNPSQSVCSDCPNFLYLKEVFLHLLICLTLTAEAMLALKFLLVLTLCLGKSQQSGFKKIKFSQFKLS